MSIKYIIILFSIAGFFLMWIFSPLLSQWGNSVGVDLSAGFGAIFNFSLFFSGLLFTVYVVILAPANPFITAIFHTDTFADFQTWLSMSVWVNIFVSFFTIYYLITGFPQSINVAERALISFWSLFAILAFLLVLRVIYLFILLVKNAIKIKPKDYS